MKIAHESPISIFDIIQKETDYDYCLVHLYVENEQYRNKFLEAKQRGREIILDNSIFELGEAFDSDSYVEVIKELQPDWYIIPDSLENYHVTCQNYNNFVEKYPNLPGKKIGVIQGKTYSELVLCYNYLTTHTQGVDMIGISFDYSIYEKWFPSLTKLESWSNGRMNFLKELSKEIYFRQNIPIHLLGCSLYTEFKNYTSEFQKKNKLQIYSLDTSNPIVCGLHSIALSKHIKLKPSKKLFELINHQVSDSELKLILRNIKEFKRYQYA